MALVVVAAVGIAAAVAMSSDVVLASSRSAGVAPHASDGCRARPVAAGEKRV